MKWMKKRSSKIPDQQFIWLNAKQYVGPAHLLVYIHGYTHWCKAPGFTGWAGRPVAWTAVGASGQVRTQFQATSPTPSVSIAMALWGPDRQMWATPQSKPWAQEVWNRSRVVWARHRQDCLLQMHLCPGGMGAHHLQSRGHAGLEKGQLLPPKGWAGKMWGLWFTRGLWPVRPHPPEEKTKHPDPFKGSPAAGHFIAGRFPSGDGFMVATGFLLSFLLRFLLLFPVPGIYSQPSFSV